MKELLEVSFDPAQFRSELDQLRDLLASKDELSERDDIQPLFKASPQLTAFIGTCIPDMGGPANRLAYEFPIFGDYAADILIGNVDRKVYCAIELEDARPTSIFKSHGRATPEWGARFEHGFSQLVDWFFLLDDHRNSASFTRHFGYGDIEFFGMLLIGRTKWLGDYQQRRLRWRSGRINVNTHKVYCRTFDELYESLNGDWRLGSLISSGS
jgi:hypothetical protein